MKFRVLMGVHSESKKIYNAGDVVDSKSNLLKHNKGNSVRYERVADDAKDTGKPVIGASEEQKDAVAEAAKKGFEDGNTAALPKAPLESMTVEQLRKMAEEYEIDVSTCKRKEELVNTLRSEGLE